MNTDRDAPPPTKLAAIEAALATKATQPVILLARPFEPGNIGAVARAMLNFGLSDLRLVAPLTQPWLNEEAQQRACGAAPLLDEAQTFVDMPAATDDLQLVLATTARPREANVPVLTPRALRDAPAAPGAPGGDVAEVRMYGDVVLRLLSLRDGYDGAHLPGYAAEPEDAAPSSPPDDDQQ